MEFIDKIIGLFNSEDQSEEAESQEAASEEDGADQEAEAADEEASQEDQGERTYTPEALESLLAEKKAEWQQEQDTQLQQRLQTLPESDRMKTEIYQLKTELARRDLQMEIVAKLEENQLPSSVADLIQYGDREATMQSLDKVVSTIKAAVDEGVKNRLRGKPPVGIGVPSNLSMDAFADTLDRALK